MGDQPEISKLRRVREAKGLSRQELSYLAKVTPQTIRALEDGHNGPTLATAVKLARALGVPLADLFDIDAEVAS